MEQLLSIMPTDLKIWVSERKPKDSSEAGELADDYVRARGRDGSMKVLSGDQKKEVRKCHNCGKEGHIARYCLRTNQDKQHNGVEVKKENEKTDQKKVKCYNYGQLGHISTKCLEKALFCGTGVT